MDRPAGGFSCAAAVPALFFSCATAVSAVFLTENIATKRTGHTAMSLYD